MKTLSFYLALVLIYQIQARFQPFLNFHIDDFSQVVDVHSDLLFASEWKIIWISVDGYADGVYFLSLTILQLQVDWFSSFEKFDFKFVCFAPAV